MPRPLPLLSDDFNADLGRLISFANRLEQNHLELTAPRSGLTLSGLELSYQLIYLKIFLLWEDYIEDIFLRLLCGYHSNGGAEPLNPGNAYFRSREAARRDVLGRADYKLWHNPNHLLQRSDHYFLPARSYFRSVISANSANLTLYANVRHHVAHAQDHARQQFDAATMTLAGRRYPASSAGKFLRDSSGPDPNRRWLQYIGEDFHAIIHQFC